MPDEKNDLFKYSGYFTRKVPGFSMQAALLALIGIVAVAMPMVIGAAGNPFYAGAVGVAVVSMPALFTVATIKIVRKKTPVRHIMIITLVSTAVYAVFVAGSVTSIVILRNITAGYMLLLLGNAAIFGYWLLMDKVVIDMRKSAAVAAAIQPVYNVIFYAAIHSTAFAVDIPVSVLLLKLVGGMMVFFVLVYLFIYFIDRPMKKSMNISSVRTFTLMLNQWLYDTGTSEFFPEVSFGVRKNISMDIMILKGRRRHKAIFVKPDIHFGPFKNVGGAVAPEVLGSLIQKRYSAVPFIMHGAVNASQNPVSTSQTYRLASSLRRHLDSIADGDFARARGGIYVGRSGPCSAIDIRINSSRTVILTKAPMVVEDIDPAVGAAFKEAATGKSVSAMIIDAHNSRFEDAHKVELRGVYKGSPYVKGYMRAIDAALAKERMNPLRFGASRANFFELLGQPKDIGKGPTSACVFSSEGRSFGIINFDSNNMLPGFRDDVIKHLKERFGVEFELLTTDTHSVNTINLPVSNVLGSKTESSRAMPHIDRLVQMAINDMEPAKAYIGSVQVDGFRLWGNEAEKQVTQISRDLVRKTKYLIPSIALAGLVLAAVIIYVI